MRIENGLHAQPGPWLAPVLIGGLLGTAWQLQQAQLWAASVYRDLLLLALVSWLVSLLIRRSAGARLLMVMLAVALLGYGSTGWRAARQAQSALAPALEGRDLLVQGVVAGMSQRNEAGQRFRFELESAWLDDQWVKLPQRRRRKLSFSAASVSAACSGKPRRCAHSWARLMPSLSTAT